MEQGKQLIPFCSSRPSYLPGSLHELKAVFYILSLHSEAHSAGISVQF